jgi:hypothetical protein
MRQTCWKFLRRVGVRAREYLPAVPMPTGPGPRARSIFPFSGGNHLKISCEWLFSVQFVGFEDC